MKINRNKTLFNTEQQLSSQGVKSKNVFVESNFLILIQLILRKFQAKG